MDNDQLNSLDALMRYPEDVMEVLHFMRELANSHCEDGTENVRWGWALDSLEEAVEAYEKEWAERKKNAYSDAAHGR